VAKRQGVTGRPKDLAGPTWPNARLEKDSPVRYAQEITKRLEAAIGNRSLREVGRDAGLDHTTISALLSGDRWADFVTLAKLEAALDALLWPFLVLVL